MGCLRRHHLAAARPFEHVLDPRRPDEEGAVGAAGVDTRHGMVVVDRVGDPLETGAIDEIDVELTDLSLDQPGEPVPVEDCRGALVGLTGEPLERLVDPGAELAGRDESGRPLNTRCVARISSPGSSVETSTASTRASDGAPLPAAYASEVS